MTNRTKIGNIIIGENSPIIVQSMTSTDTANIAATAEQILALHKAGSEMVRITVNNEAAAKAVLRIRLIIGNIPLIGDFHYNGHQLLEDFPEMAQTLDKYRINPGNVGFGKKQDLQFSSIIKTAIKYDKTIRIGVNWGSLDAGILQKLIDKNKYLPFKEVQKMALIESALASAKFAEELGLSADKIVISCKVSDVRTLIELYQELACTCDYALHLGLTEAGIGHKGIIASAAALAPLLLDGIGDTIRISLTPAPNEPRTKEVEIAREILQVLGFRSFAPTIISCPGCGRTSNEYFRILAEDIGNWLKWQMPIWGEKYTGVEKMKVAVMGCIVNGPGESKNANIGISLPGNGESPIAPIFADGKKITTLRGDNIAQEFKQIIMQYIINKYSNE